MTKCFYQRGQRFSFLYVIYSDFSCHEDSFLRGAVRIVVHTLSLKHRAFHNVGPCHPDRRSCFSTVAEGSPWDWLELWKALNIWVSRTRLIFSPRSEMFRLHTVKSQCSARHFKLLLSKRTAYQHPNYEYFCPTPHRNFILITFLFWCDRRNCYFQIVRFFKQKIITPHDQKSLH